MNWMPLPSLFLLQHQQTPLRVPFLSFIPMREFLKATGFITKSRFDHCGYESYCRSTSTLINIWNCGCISYMGRSEKCDCKWRYKSSRGLYDDCCKSHCRKV